MPQQHMNSLALVLDLMNAERDRRLAHLDGLDAKAGVILGFSSVLVALGPNIPGWFQAPGLGAAAAAVGLSLSASWPRQLSVLDYRRVAEYVWSEPRFAQLRLIDALELMDREAASAIEAKATRLKSAVVALGVAGVLYGGGVMFT